VSSAIAGDPVPKSPDEVLRFGAAARTRIITALARYGLIVRELPVEAEIPGSYWGAPEAGLIGNELMVRSDTPVHSALHESCHFICMDEQRRATLHTDAGGTVAEENAVCLLQILIGEQFSVFRANGCLPTWMPGDILFALAAPEPGLSGTPRTPATGCWPPGLSTKPARYWCAVLRAQTHPPGYNRGT